MNNILTKCCARLFLCHDVFTVQPSEIPTEIPVMNASDKNSSIIKQNQSAANGSQSQLKLLVTQSTRWLKYTQN